MELYEANRILRAVKVAISADGYKLPYSAETDGLLMLLGKLDMDKYLAPKIKHARAQDTSSSSYQRLCKLIYFFRALRAVEKGLPDPVTAVSMNLLHKSIAGDIHDDAGRLRTIDSETDGSAHTDPKYIPGSVKSIITKMNGIEPSPITAKDDFAGYLSHYMRELIILHPFEYCSEFTVRIFILMFCKMKGFSLGYHRTAPSVIKSAEQKAFQTDDVTPLFTMFVDCLSYDHKTVKEGAPTAAPRTRREAAKDLYRPARASRPVENDTKKQKDTASDDRIRRAVRLQQKISKLNEQLAELIKPLDDGED